MDDKIIREGYKPRLTDSGLASVDVVPGHLVEKGGAEDYRLHSEAQGDVAPVRFVRSRPELGEDIGDTIPSGDSITVDHPRSGEVIYMWLAAGENVAEDARLASNGDGTLAAFTPQADLGAGEEVEVQPIVGRAEEAVDNGGGVEAVRIPVRIA